MSTIRFPKKSTRLNLQPLEHREVPATLYVDGFGSSTSSLSLSDAISLVNTAGDLTGLSSQELQQVDTTEPFGTNDRIVIPSYIVVTGIPFTLRKNVIIQGTPGCAVDGGNINRCFNIQPGVKVTISDLIIRNGTSSIYGGGINNDGDLTLIRSTVTGNSVTATDDFIGNGGGGIRNNGRLTVIDSTISNNTTNRRGGGIASTYGKDLTIIRSTISGNTATIAGGIYLHGSDNHVLNASISDSTITGNTPQGIHSRQSSNASVSLRLNNSIVVGNNGTRDIEQNGTLLLYGDYNLLGGGGFDQSRLSSTNTYNVNLAAAKIGPLANNGAPTQTHALLPGSPALNAANPMSNQPDQRGQLVFGGRRDIGAYEAGVEAFPNTAPVLSVPTTHTAVRGFDLTFNASATDSDLVNGQSNKLTYSLVGAPTGAWIDPDTGAFSWTPNEGNQLKTYTFKVRVVDDGVPAMYDTKTVTVALKFAVLDGNLVIGGSAGNDIISVTPSKDLTQIVVKQGKSTMGTFPAGAVPAIFIHGMDGNDTISVSTKITRPTFLFGDDGADKLTGGGGDDVLVGGAGKDMLKDSLGRNVLIGGEDADKLTGGTGEDLLIAGLYTFDTDLLVLYRLSLDWQQVGNNGDYASRVATLTSGTGVLGSPLDSSVIQDDFAKDILVGGKPKVNDWYISSVLDVITGFENGETRTTI